MLAPREASKRGAIDVGKEKPGPKPDPKPDPTPDPKPEPPVEEKATVNPATGERVVAECLASVLRKLDNLIKKVEAQGKTIQEGGTTPEKPKPDKPDATSAPAKKPGAEPLDGWSN